MIFKKLKPLMYSIFFLSLSGLVAFVLFVFIHTYYELSVHGEVILGAVVDYEYKKQRRVGYKGRSGTSISHRHQVIYDNHKKWFTLEKAFPNGHQVFIAYSKRQPNIALQTNELDLWKLLREDFLLYIILIPFLIMCIAFSIYNFRKFINGKSKT